jgi:trehalose 6-phosphate phosphatase
VDPRLPGLIAPLAAAPDRSAAVFDIDGTLAPIVPDPAAARVPPDALDALAALPGRYALVACITGRAARDGRALVPIPGVEIAGNHGLELLRGDRVELAPEAVPHREAVRHGVALVASDGILAELGCRMEDKGITFSVHFRTSPRPERVMRYLETQIGPKLAREGLEWRFGRKVFEVRPPVAVDKGAALVRLREGRGIEHTLFVGDDRTDLDAFREATVRIAVASDEGPREVVEAAGAVVSSPAEVVALLRLLAGG